MQTIKFLEGTEVVRPSREGFPHFDVGVVRNRKVKRDRWSRRQNSRGSVYFPDSDGFKPLSREAIRKIEELNDARATLEEKIAQISVDFEETFRKEAYKI